MGGFTSPGPNPPFSSPDPFCAVDPELCYGFPQLPPIIIINQQVPTLSGVQNALDELGGGIDVLRSIAGLIAAGVGQVLLALATLWGTILKPLLQMIQRIIDKITRILNKILKPYLDYMRRVRQLILDLYNRFVRPVIVLIQSVRRIIAVLHIFHIHVLDGLDKQLAKLEAKILRPIIDLLRRTNTIGGWISFILNAENRLHRGLLLGSVYNNVGGVFSLLANAPGYDRGPFVDVPAAPGVGVPFTVSSFIAASNAAAKEVAAELGTDPLGDLGECLLSPFPGLGEGDPVGDLLRCLGIESLA